MARTRTFAGFTTNIPSKTRHYGGCLMFEINASHEQIRAKLGTSLSAERKDKYSSSLFVRHADTGFIYSVYMCFGNWRIGSVDTDPYHDMSRNETYVEIAHKLESVLVS